MEDGRFVEGYDMVITVMDLPMFRATSLYLSVFSVINSGPMVTHLTTWTYMSFDDKTLNSSEFAEIMFQTVVFFKESLFYMYSFYQF